MERGGGGRPSRSDVHLSEKEEAKIAAATREHFDGLAPRRHTKPQRSDYSSEYTDVHSDDGLDNGLIPEYVQFQRLENGSQKLVYNGSDVPEEFVETEYYNDLSCIDKQHHTTGTGFIKVENEKGTSLSLTPDSTTCCHASCKGNPATNDWIPAATHDMINFVSDKPNRSEN